MSALFRSTFSADAALKLLYRFASRDKHFPTSIFMTWHIFDKCQNFKIDEAYKID